MVYLFVAGDIRGGQVSLNRKIVGKLVNDQNALVKLLIEKRIIIQQELLEKILDEREIHISAS